MGQILPSYPYNGPENQNFEKMKKMPGDIILLHMCTINEDHMIYGSWNKVQQAEFFVTLGHFLPVDHWLPQKSKFSKIEKQTWRYYHFLNVHHKWQSYDLWLRYRTRQTLFVILGCFLPSHPPDDPKNQNFEKMKATLGDIILQMCTINDNHMMYGSWDMEYDRKKFSSFWTVFCSFTNNPENQNFWKNERNRDIILHMCPINDNHMMYGSWNMEHHGRFCHFGPFCALLPHQQSEKKQNFEKWKKTPEDIIIVHLCTTNDDHRSYDAWFLNMEHDRHIFLSFWTIFSPLTPLMTTKIKILKKWSQHLEILSFYTCVP